MRSWQGESSKDGKRGDRTNCRAGRRRRRASGRAACTHCLTARRAYARTPSVRIFVTAGRHGGVGAQAGVKRMGGGRRRARLLGVFRFLRHDPLGDGARAGARSTCRASKNIGASRTISVAGVPHVVRGSISTIAHLHHAWPARRWFWARARSGLAAVAPLGLVNLGQPRASAACVGRASPRKVAGRVLLRVRRATSNPARQAIPVPSRGTGKLSAS